MRSAECDETDTLHSCRLCFCSVRLVLSFSRLDIHMRSIRPFIFFSLSLFFGVLKKQVHHLCLCLLLQSDEPEGALFLSEKKKEKTDMFLQIDLPAVEQAPDTHIQTHLHLRKQATCVWESFFPPVIGCNWRYLLFIVSLKTTGNQKQKTASDVYFCVCVYEIIETCQFQQFTFLFFLNIRNHKQHYMRTVHGLLFMACSCFGKFQCFDCVLK